MSRATKLLALPGVLVLLALGYAVVTFSKNGGLYFSPTATYTIEGTNITYQANRKDISSGRIKVVGSNNLSSFVAIINFNDCNVANYTINKKQASESDNATPAATRKTINGTTFYVNGGMSTNRACTEEPADYEKKVQKEVEAIVASLAIT